MASHKLFERVQQTEFDPPSCVGSRTMVVHSRNPERPSAHDGLLWSEIYVREGEGWQIRVSTLASKTPLPAATAETK